MLPLPNITTLNSNFSTVVNISSDVSGLHEGVNAVRVDANTVVGNYTFSENMRGYATKNGTLVVGHVTTWDLSHNVFISSNNANKLTLAVDIGNFETASSAIGEGIRVYKSGKSCFASFEAFRASKAYAVNETIVTLPESFRPAYAVSFMDTLGSSHQRIIVNTDGTILSTSAITNGQGIRGSVSYVTP